MNAEQSVAPAGAEAVLPRGFAVMPASSLLHEMLGPFYGRWDTDFTLGFWVAQKHANPAGKLHGGVISAVADMAIGYSLRTMPDTPVDASTTSLAMHFVNPAKPGEWIEVRTDVVRRGRMVLFGNCFFWAGERRIAHASSSFVVVSPSSDDVKETQGLDGGHGD